MTKTVLFVSEASSSTSEFVFFTLNFVSVEFHDFVPLRASNEIWIAKNLTNFFFGHILHVVWENPCSTAYVFEVEI